MNEYLQRYRQQVDEIVEVCHRSAELGYGPAVSGNVSYRMKDADVVLITPTQTPKRLMRAEDICVVTSNGTPLYIPEGKKPTGEEFLHLHVMSCRPDINAVIHAHPPLVTGLSTTQYGKRALELPLAPEAMMQLGRVITVPYADPNRDELGYRCDPVIDQSNGFVLESHGALVCSSGGVLTAVESLQIMESLAESIQAAYIMGHGEIKPLTEKDIDGLDEVIGELGWPLPCAPGRYRTLRQMFSEPVNR